MYGVDSTTPPQSPAATVQRPSVARIARVSYSSPAAAALSVLSIPPTIVESANSKFESVISLEDFGGLDSVSFGGASASEANLADLPEAPYSAFGPFEKASIRVTGGEVEVAVLPGESALDRPALLAWVERAAGDVAGYYGRFPLPRTLVILIPGGRRVRRRP